MTVALDLLGPDEVLGSTTPRLVTPPLVVGPPGPCGCGCALTPETSYGFGADQFARETLLVPFDPWQRFAAIHAGELLPDGRPRFRRVVIVVARQNGKTHLLLVLCLYWMFVEQQPMILGTSTQTKYAKEPWQKAYDLALKVPDLEAEMPPGRLRGMRRKASEEQWRTIDGSRYLVTPGNAEGGRSLTLNRVVADELAWQFDHAAYGAAYYAMRAVPDAQYFGLSTPLDDRSAVFNGMRKEAVSLIEGGEGDPRLGLLEWSAPESADPLDVRALAQANPNAGHRFPMSDLVNEARSAVRLGGGALVEFKNNAMCVRVPKINAAIDPTSYADCFDRAVDGSFEDLRGRVALCFDVSRDGRHATLYAAAEQPDGRARIGLVRQWEGEGCADRAGRELPALVAQVKPRAVGVLRGGGAEATVANLVERPGVWPPPGVELTEIRGELTAVCMGLAEQFDARRVARGTEALLDEHAAAAEKLPRGAAWVFSHGDALYAAAGAVHLARTLPPPPVIRILSAVES